MYTKRTFNDARNERRNIIKPDKSRAKKERNRKGGKRKKRKRKGKKDTGWPCDLLRRLSLAGWR